MNAMKAIIVDDDRFSLRVFEEMAKNTGLAVQTFINPLDACKYVETNEVDIAFVDYMMKDMDGLEFIKFARAYHPDIPIVMITGETDDKTLKIKALESGATEFLTKPVEIPDFIARVRNLVNLRKAQLLLSDRAKLLEEEVREATLKIVERENDTLRLLAMVAELKDPETANHISRMAHYSKILASSINKNPAFADLVFHSTPLHDVGKLGTTDRILLKPGKLTNEEFGIMKQHSTMGYTILKESKSKSKYIKSGAIISLTHHERYDGGGYPNSLKGENIHILGRIAAISDVFDALTTKRPYKKAWPFEEGIDYMISNRGTQFDPKLVDAFTVNTSGIKEIYETFQD